MRFTTNLAGVLIALFFMASLSWATDAADANEPTVPEAILTADIAIDELALRLTPLTVAELAAAAAAWRDIVKAKTEELVSAQIAANEAKDDDNDAVEQQARQQLTELAEARGALFDRYSTVVNSWEKF